MKNLRLTQKTLNDIKNSDLYLLYKYTKNHADEEDSLNWIALIAIEERTVYDDEEVNSWIFTQYDRVYNRDEYDDDEDRAVEHWLLNELESGRTAEAKRLIEEVKENKKNINYKDEDVIDEETYKKIRYIENLEETILSINKNNTDWFYRIKENMKTKTLDEYIEVLELIIC